MYFLLNRFNTIIHCFTTFKYAKLYNLPAKHIRKLSNICPANVSLVVSRRYSESSRNMSLKSALNVSMFDQLQH